MHGQLYHLRWSQRITDRFLYQQHQRRNRQRQRYLDRRCQPLRQQRHGQLHDQRQYSDDHVQRSGTEDVRRCGLCVVGDGQFRTCRDLLGERCLHGIGQHGAHHRRRFVHNYCQPGWRFQLQRGLHECAPEHRESHAGDHLEQPSRHHVRNRARRNPVKRDSIDGW